MKGFHGEGYRADVQLSSGGSRYAYTRLLVYGRRAWV